MADLTTRIQQTFAALEDGQSALLLTTDQRITVTRYGGLAEITSTPRADQLRGRLPDWETVYRRLEGALISIKVQVTDP